MDIYGKGKPILHTGFDLAYPGETGFAFHTVNNPSVEDIKDKLGFSAINRKVVDTGDGYELKENVASYSGDFGAKMGM